jgi:hypothetical protein
MHASGAPLRACVCGWVHGDGLGKAGVEGVWVFEYTEAPIGRTIHVWGDENMRALGSRRSLERQAYAVLSFSTMASTLPCPPLYLPVISL